jgi:hypothetical protein
MSQDFESGDLSQDTPPNTGKPQARFWPWVVLALATLPAVWHVLHFEGDIDHEFPRVERPTFSQFPSPAYRLAEPGDTIDRVALYFSAAGLVFAATALIAPGSRGRGYWLSALAVSLAVFWEAANPGPVYGGWHGLGWRAISHPESPLVLRLALIVAAIGLAATAIGPFWLRRDRLRSDLAAAAERGNRLLFVVALVLMAGRFLDAPAFGPPGYWPRWSLVFGMLALDLGMLREAFSSRPRPRLGEYLIAAGSWAGLVALGLVLVWYHRPLARFRPVEDGKVYISAMPTKRGLEVAYARHPFRTIINLYPEESLIKSPHFEDEKAFAREHGIRYILSPGDSSLEASSAFLDKTLAAAQDPNAWPILVHCHANMDRTPAWMGIYRFVIQGRPLIEVMREIEQHRGYRPKASVTLLYNRVLEPRASARYADDPTAAILRRCAEGTVDPALSRQDEAPAQSNPESAVGVSESTDRGEPLRRR